MEEQLQINKFPEPKFVRKPQLEPFFVAFSMFPIVRGSIVQPKKGIPYFDYNHDYFHVTGLEFFKKQGL